MIYESHPWKQDLLRRKRLIQKYNRAEFYDEEDDRAYTVIEKAIFYSAFIIRKLLDCKGKVSDEVDEYQFTLKGFLPKRRIDFMHRWPDKNTHDWEHESSYTKNGKEICNWLIHSFVFYLCYNEAGEIDSFCVSSDKDRNKILYCVNLKDWIDYIDFVGSDYVVATDMYSDESKMDYIFTKKERGKL